MNRIITVAYTDQGDADAVAELKSYVFLLGGEAATNVSRERVPHFGHSVDAQSRRDEVFVVCCVVVR